MKYDMKKLSDFADIIVGYAFKSEAFNIDGKGVRLVRGKNITHFALRWGDDTRWWNDFSIDLNRYYLKKGDILIGMDGSLVGKNYARVHSEDLPLLLVQRVACIRAKDMADQDFIWACISNVDFELYIESIKTGTSIPHISAKQISEYLIPDFTNIDREKIGMCIRLLDDKIECNNQINKNLEEQAKKIFKEWFIDNSENASWKRGNFSDLITSTLSGDWGKDELSGNNTEKVYCIRGADIPEVKTGNKGKMPVRYIIPKNLKSKQLEDGDIVVEISGGSPSQSTGRSTVITQSLLDRYDSSIVCTNFCKALKPVKEYSMFIYYYFQYLYDKNIFFSYENGTTGIKNLDLTGFLETESIVIPPKNLIDDFHKFCTSSFNLIFANGKESENLSNIRDSLLPKLMSGELDVSDIGI